MSLVDDNLQCTALVQFASAQSNRIISENINAWLQVLDEADRLLSMDFEAEIDEILKVVPKERRTYLFSATMTNKVAKLQRACLKNPVKVGNM